MRSRPTRSDVAASADDEPVLVSDPGGRRRPAARPLRRLARRRLAVRTRRDRRGARVARVLLDRTAVAAARARRLHGRLARAARRLARRATLDDRRLPRHASPGLRAEGNLADAAIADGRGRDDGAGSGLGRARPRARPADPRARAREGRPARDLHGAARRLRLGRDRLLRRPPGRPPPDGADALPGQDVGGPRCRNGDRGARDLLRALPVGLHERLAVARARRRDRRCRAAGRPLRVGGQARPEREGQRPAAWRPRRDARPARLAPVCRGRGLLHDPRPALIRIRPRFVHFEQMTTIALLGATGSIGRQALEIIGADPELELVAAASGSQPIDGLAPLTQAGGDLTELLDRAEPDVVLNAVVGFAGLPATLWALERRGTLAVAHKESLVAAGELALAAQRRGGGLLLPVDSEHSAAFQCLEGREAEQVDSLVLTGSGGPFRARTREQLEDVTPEEALAHPTWSMGPKITVDSATLANKGLELIEAHFLFGLPYEQIEVVVHPTSVVHALVRFRDGAALAHLGYPDMRVPISFALTYPERAATPVSPLDLAGGLTLEFRAPDLETFPMLALARAAGERGGTYPCAYNAANEVAVAAFLEGPLPFLGIAEALEETLAAWEGGPARDLDDLVDADAEARRLTEQQA